MKLLILNGSPKGDSSDTLKMSKAFARGFQRAAGGEVTVINVIEKRIGYCTGCFQCKVNGGYCPIEDDMPAILEEIKASDVVVYSFPLWCNGMPAPMKALIDRKMPLTKITMVWNKDRWEHIPQVDLSKQRKVMICGCGFPNSENNFEGMTKQFELMFPSDHTVINIPESPMFNIKDADPVTKPRLALIEKAGEVFARTGSIPEEMMAELESPMLPPKVYAMLANGEMRTPPPEIMK